MRGAAEDERLTGTRWAGLDGLRGVAVLLMVVDHVLIVAGASEWWGLLATRASLPLFCLVAGALAAGSTRVVRPRVLAAAVPAGLIGGYIGVGQPDVLIVLSLGLAVVATAGRRWPAATIGAAVIQPVTWPVGWDGYEPGTVVALLMAGSWLGWRALDRLGSRLGPALAPAAWVGRHPLAWYLGHLSVLGAWVWWT